MTERLTVVIGASRGIGRHLATVAASKGHTVLIAARNGNELELLADELMGFEVPVSVLVGDLLAGEGLDQLAAEIRSHEGPVGVYVTAATIGPVGPFLSMDLDAWSAALVANVAGTARVLQASLAAMKKTDIAVLFAGGGVGGPRTQPRVSSYTTSKAALANLVEVVARELGEDGAALMAIAPGAFPTGFNDAVLATDPEIAGEELLTDVTKNNAKEFDASRLDALIEYLEHVDCRPLAGRILSARWETPDALEESREDIRTSVDMFRLRRVDGDVVTARSW